MRRHAPPSEWRTNVSLGSRAENPAGSTPEEEELAIGTRPEP